MKREIENYGSHILSIMRTYNPLCRDLEGTTTMFPSLEITLELNELRGVMNETRI